MKSVASASVLLWCFTLGGCLIVQPMMLQHRVSGTAKMTCVLEGSICSNVNWIGPALTAGPSSRIVKSGHFQASLTINDLRIRDLGSYSCVCGENRSPPALLEVFRDPDFSTLDRNQSFERGDTATIICNAFSGDPPSTPVWVRNGVTITSAYMDTRYRLQRNNQSLVIEDIRDSDAGVFTCGFNTITGYKSREINIHVTEPKNPGFIIIEPTQRSINITYGEPLMLKCRVDVNSDSVNISWIINQQTIVHNSMLLLQPKEVVSGLYQCFAHNSNNERYYSVFVTVNAKPTFTNKRIVETPTAEASEGSRLERNEVTITTAPVVGGNLKIQWKRKDSNSLMDFGSRLKVTWSQQNIRWIIFNARLEDSGDYLMNISNDFGYTELNTLLVVTKTEKALVQITISDHDCQFLKDHKVELAKAIARAYQICDTYCGDVQQADVDCTQDTEAVVTLSIPKDYVVNAPLTNVAFNLSGIPPFTGAVCMDCAAGTEPPSHATLSSEKKIVITCVVLAVLLTVALVVLVLTVLICKCWKSHCKKHRVAEVNAEEPPVDMDNPQRLRECSGYVKVARPPVIQPPVALSAATTPITEPFLSSRQLYLLPSHVAVSRGVAGHESSRSPGNRPNHLFIRSNSYHGHSRTRTPPDTRTRDRMRNDC